LGIAKLQAVEVDPAGEFIAELIQAIPGQVAEGEVGGAMEGRGEGFDAAAGEGIDGEAGIQGLARLGVLDEEAGMRGEGVRIVEEAGDAECSGLLDGEGGGGGGFLASEVPSFEGEVVGARC